LVNTTDKIQLKKQETIHLFQIDNLSVLLKTNDSAISNKMHNTVSSPSLSAIGTGIVPLPMHSPQPQYMQSITSSAANGKDEIRGWLYKWTNVNETHPLDSNKFLSFY
jgi:hypothetical protein